MNSLNLNASIAEKVTEKVDNSVTISELNPSLVFRVQPEGSTEPRYFRVEIKYQNGQGKTHSYDVDVVGFNPTTEMVVSRDPWSNQSSEEEIVNIILNAIGYKPN